MVIDECERGQNIDTNKDQLNTDDVRYQSELLSSFCTCLEKNNLH